MAYTDLQPMNDRTHRRIALAHRLYAETPNFFSTPAKAHQRRTVDIFLSYNAGTLTQLQYKYLMSAYAGILKCLEALTNPLHPRTVVFTCTCRQTQPYIFGAPGRVVCHASQGDVGLIVSYKFVKRYVKTVTLLLDIMMPDTLMFTNVVYNVVKDIPGYQAQQRRLERKSTIICNPAPCQV